MSNEMCAAIVGALVGALITGVATYIGAVLIQNRTLRKDACARFFFCFSQELLRLEQGDMNCVMPLIEARLSMQERAASDFRFYITDPIERKRFDMAWAEYSKSTSDYMDVGQKGDLEECKKLALDRIHALLLFAGFKR